MNKMGIRRKLRRLISSIVLLLVISTSADVCRYITIIKDGTEIGLMCIVLLPVLMFASVASTLFVMLFTHDLWQALK